MHSKEKDLERKIFVVGQEQLRPGEIPSIAVYGENLPEAWESAVLATWHFGTQIPTQYDQECDPESRDASMMISVVNPFAEPRIHKALPCGLDELWVYTEEVTNGIHDFRVGEDGWSYSYHDRLSNWPGISGWRKIEETLSIKIGLNIDQVKALIDQLGCCPHSRRAQAITWNPMIDAGHHEPPCLQRIWCRVVKSEEEIYLLEMNTHWRSRDALKAAFMNMYALTELQREIAERISKQSGYPVRPGRYIDISDSFHLYGSYIRRGEIADFLASLEKRTFEQRTFRSDDSIVQEEFVRGKGRF